MRLIDADAIKLPKGFFEKVDNVPKFYEWLDDQLTVDPVKHGYWNHDYDDVSITGTCSVCGWQSMLMETDVADMPYCPNCGAKMDMPTIKAEPVIHCIDCITDETAQKIIEEAKSLKLRHCNKLGWAYCCGNCDECRITVTTV